MMMMKMKNPSRVISTATSLVRRLCTAAVTAAEVPREEASLYRRLSILRATGGTVAQTLNEYSGEGRIVTKYELVSCVRSLRKFKNYSHALEIMEWMENRNINLSITDHALRLDLISKAKGITEAENYFNGLSPFFQDMSTYGTLLNSYCKEKMADKAWDLFKRMDELKISSTSLAFDNLIFLCLRLGSHEEVPPLVEEMKRRKLPLNTSTYNAWMQSYAGLNDIEAAERVFEEMVKEDKDKCNWTAYSNLAVLYVKAGLFEKAELALKKVETMMKYRDRLAYHFLISLNASTSNLTEVKRVWKSLKLALPTTNNRSYLVMLQALNKLDDVEGLKECFDEWKSTCSHHDMRLANAAIMAYLRHNMIKEAELVFEEAPKKASKSLFNAREMFMTFFLKNCRVDLALRHMEATVADVNNDKWRMAPELVSAFMKYFELVKDVDGAEEFCKLLKKVNSLDSKAYHPLLQIYLVAGKTAPDIRTRMENDDIEISSGLENLLESVLPK